MFSLLVAEPAQGVVRALLFSGILGLVGATLFAWRIVPVFEGDMALRTRDGTGRVVRWSGVLTSLAVAARLVQQAAAFADTPEQWATAVPVVLGATTWGKGWILQAVALPCALLAARWATPGTRRIALGDQGPVAGTALGVALLALCATPALSGHAVGAPRLTALAVALDTLHVVAAGAWLGTLATVAAVALPASRALPGSGLIVLRVLARFSPIALASAAALAVTGAFASWLHLESIAALWSTDYGLMLTRKLVVLAGVAAAGAYNWKVVTPRLARGDDAGILRRSIAVELALAAILVAITAVLVATPLPGE